MPKDVCHLSAEDLFFLYTQMLNNMYYTILIILCRIAYLSHAYDQAFVIHPIELGQGQCSVLKDTYKNLQCCTPNGEANVQCSTYLESIKKLSRGSVGTETTVAVHAKSLKVAGTRVKGFANKLDAARIARDAISKLNGFTVYIQSQTTVFASSEALPAGSANELWISTSEAVDMGDGIFQVGARLTGREEMGKATITARVTASSTDPMLSPPSLADFGSSSIMDTCNLASKTTIRSGSFAYFRHLKHFNRDTFAPSGPVYVARVTKLSEVGKLEAEITNKKIIPPGYSPIIKNGSLVQIHSEAYVIGEDTFLQDVANSHAIPCSDGFINILTYSEGDALRVVKADRLVYVSRLQPFPPSPSPNSLPPSLPPSSPPPPHPFLPPLPSPPPPELGIASPAAPSFLATCPNGNAFYDHCDDTGTGIDLSSKIVCQHGQKWGTCGKCDILNNQRGCNRDDECDDCGCFSAHQKSYGVCIAHNPYSGTSQGCGITAEGAFVCTDPVEKKQCVCVDTAAQQTLITTFYNDINNALINNLDKDTRFWTRYRDEKDKGNLP